MSGVDEAEQWLRQLLADLATIPQYSHFGFEYYRRVRFEISQYTDELKALISRAIGRWIESNVESDVWQGIAIADECLMVEHLAAIEEVYESLPSSHPYKGPDNWLRDLVERMTHATRRTQADQ